MSDESTDIKATFSFVSLGCAKNLVDSERMLGLLAQDGYVLVPETESPDLVIVNTCGFIDVARQESMAVIHEMVDRKNAGDLKGVIVAGCLAERFKDKLLEDEPGIDQVVGVFGREEISKAAGRIVGGLEEQRTIFNPAPIRAQDDTARLRITPRHMAYLKVSEGCDRLCTFCAIPGMRGKHVTKPMDEVIREAHELVADGVKELILVAQDMTYYGMDLYGRPRLAELLQRLDQEVEGLAWIRVLYCYPQFFTDELYETLGSAKKILPYLDMPLQHIDDRVLRRMNRRHTRAQTEEIVDRLRETIPNLILRTTFITGFPGETNDEFATLERFVEAKKFDRMGVFTYSDEPGTPAFKLPGRVADELKIERQERLMEIQRPIAEAVNARFVGQDLDVIIDVPAPSGNGRTKSWVGRGFADAPDVDGVVLVKGLNLVPGDLVKCRIEETEGYDFIATAINEPDRPERAPRKPRKTNGPGGPDKPRLPILG
jgi:ribosomal protein S12 methylthiotransferase